MKEKMNIIDFYSKEMDDINSELNDSKYYLNRELSWIDFNLRVLFQASRKDVPLLERLKFLGISASNLDEFIMVRFASVIHKLLKNPNQLDLSGMTPNAEYQFIYDKIFEFKKMQHESFDKINRKLLKNNIHVCKYTELSTHEKKYVEKLFEKNIYPLITPINYDTTKDFPLIKSKQLCFIISLEDVTNINLNVLSIIPVENLNRIYKVCSDDPDESKYILLEEIIFNFLDKIFINKKILYKGLMRILRQADIELEDDQDIYIIDRMKQILYQRENSEPIFMDISDDIPKNILKLLLKVLNINKSNIYKTNNIMDYSIFAGMPIRDPLLEYDEFNPQYPQELIGEHDMFTAIDNNDIILHHPYESFGPVIKFIEHAANNPSVLAIKQTLYRVSSTDSPIVNALCLAAENGKLVSVLLEIKARFDENRNISLIDKLKLSGCKIIYGVEHLKTHCKFCLVVKNTNKGLKTYCHIGTGNYNDKTSKIYTDLSYFTSKEKIGIDLLSIFNILSGFSEPVVEGNKIFFSPYNLRSQMYKLIEREMDNHLRNKNSYIVLKLNSLSDKGIIKKLYQASEVGVKIFIFCRGICSMKPINTNISIKSLIGRYLEHSRIYYFNNEGKQDIYISSADMLTRNLDRRVELLVPLLDDDVRTKVFNILNLYLKDSFNIFNMSIDGSYNLVEKQNAFNVHEYFMNEAIHNYKFRNIPKFSLKGKKNKV